MNTAITTQSYLPLEPMARRVGVPLRFLRELARAGRVPHLKVGGRLLFSPVQVQLTLAEIAAGNAPDGAKAERLK